MPEQQLKIKTNSDVEPGDMSQLHRAVCADCKTSSIVYEWSSQDVTAELRRLGWKRTQSRGWVCPVCYNN